MNQAAIQAIITATRRANGRLANCNRCHNPYRRYSSLWCGMCRQFFRCPHQHQLLGRIVRTDGSSQGWWWCVECGKLTAARKADGLGAYLFHDLRNKRDVPPCARCESTEGTQLHHWAPRAIFGGREADRWPTAWLCQPCHSLWHRLMRQAGGVRLPPEERIDEYDLHPTTCYDTKDAA